MTPPPKGNAEDVSGKRSGTERPFFGLANQPNKSRAGANAGIRALPRNVESRYGGLGEAGVLRWFPPKLARLATRWPGFLISRPLGARKAMDRSRIIGYLIGGAIIVFSLLVIAAVLAGAVGLAVELLR